ncbi:hypothetical protein NliqN6_3714 [Naganishia liquefaciens]|uniref:Uncharacterized protein n=1 Tax=Naganishia liquefaciens TaxID=104408 RepID=A0A8H3YGK4_9TREE|nr:hypothetical protein NliqN6_3714 [Naganishia liquefaciens]
MMIQLTAQCSEILEDGRAAVSKDAFVSGATDSVRRWVSDCWAVEAGKSSQSPGRYAVLQYTRRSKLEVGTCLALMNFLIVLNGATVARRATYRKRFRMRQARIFSGPTAKELVRDDPAGFASDECTSRCQNEASDGLWRTALTNAFSLISSDQVKEFTLIGLLLRAVRHASGLEDAILMCIFPLSLKRAGLRQSCTRHEVIHVSGIAEAARPAGRPSSRGFGHWESPRGLISPTRFGMLPPARTAQRTAEHGVISWNAW